MLALALLALAPPVTLVVRVPADTPADAAVFLAGDHPAVGRWKPDGLKLTRRADGTFAADLPLAAGDTLTYKLTRGTWATAERTAVGGDRPNRTLTVDPISPTVEVTVERWAASGSVVGTLRTHRVESKALGATRAVRVWLPPAYDRQPLGRFPVLYLHDGQNLFDRATAAFGTEWQVDEALTRAGVGLVVVGLDNGGKERIAEYTFDPDPKHGGGRGEKHARFLLDEVKPLVEREYRVAVGPAGTLVGGSSLGGLVSLELARRHRGLFGGVLALSPAVWWNGEALTAAVATDAGGLSGARVWLDIGTAEGRSGEAVHRLAAALAGKGVRHRLTVDGENRDHTEAAWSARFPAAARWAVGD